VSAPTDIASLKLWCDADQGLYDATSGGSAVTADNAQIASWEPRAGTVLARLTQGTSGNKPRYDAVNGLVVSPVNQNIDAANPTSLSLPASFTFDRQDFGLFFTAEFATQWYPAGVLFLGRTSGDDANPFVNTSGNGRLGIYDGALKTAANLAAPTVNRCLVGFVGTAGNLKIWVNGDKYNATALASGTSTLTEIMGAVGQRSMSWAIKDLIFYSAALADADVTNTLVPYAQTRGVSSAAVTHKTFCVGDSITQGYGANLVRGWPTRLSLNSGVRIYPACYSGAFASELVTDRAALLDSRISSGDVVVIWAGTNDISSGGTAASAYASITSIVSGVQAAGAKAIVVTPLPRGAGAIAGEYATLRTTIIANVAAADGIVDPLSDAALAAAWGDGTYDFDDVHPNDAGYGLIAPMIQAGIIAAGGSSFQAGGGRTGMNNRTLRPY